MPITSAGMVRQTRDRWGSPTRPSSVPTTNPPPPPPHTSMGWGSCGDTSGGDIFVTHPILLQAHHTWATSPPRRMHREPEVPPPQKFHGENFDAKLKNEIFPTKLSPHENPLPPPVCVWGVCGVCVGGGGSGPFSRPLQRGLAPVTKAPPMGPQGLVGWLLGSILGVASRGHGHQALTTPLPRPGHERLCSGTLGASPQNKSDEGPLWAHKGHLGEEAPPSAPSGPIRPLSGLSGLKEREDGREREEGREEGREGGIH